MHDVRAHRHFALDVVLVHYRTRAVPVVLMLAAVPAFLPQALTPSDLFGMPSAYVPNVALPATAYAERVARTIAAESGDLQVPAAQPDGPEARPVTQAVAATSGMSAASTAGIYDPAAIPPVAMAAYTSAAQRTDAKFPGCHLSWSVLAGIGAIESGHALGAGAANPGWNGIATVPILGPVLDGSNGFAAVPDTDGGKLDGDPHWDRAVGPMQFLPSTWRVYGVDADGDGVANPEDIRDATAAAGEYLCAGGLDLDDPTQLAAAVYSYNHADWYVSAVLTVADRYAAAGPLTAGAPDQAVVQAALTFAYQRLGVDYQWGGTGPRYDCSGLTQAAYRAAGISIPRTSEQQWSSLPAVADSDLQPGDLVFFNPGEFVPGLPGHVGIYIGNGQMVDAPRTGAVVRIEPIAGFGTYLGARRPSLLGPGGAAGPPVIVAASTPSPPGARPPTSSGRPGQQPPGQQSGAPGGSTNPGQSQNPPGPAGTPPGQGGTPPGQDGTPPGQQGSPGQPGQPAGGQQGAPGNSGDAPGQQGQQAPGQPQNPAGPGATPPGQGGTPPGQQVSQPQSGQQGTPGNSGSAPGRQQDAPGQQGAPGQPGQLPPGQQGQPQSGQQGTSGNNAPGTSAPGNSGTAPGQRDQQGQTPPGQQPGGPGQSQAGTPGQGGGIFGFGIRWGRGR